MKNEYKINEALVKTWAREYHIHGGKSVVTFVLWCFVALSSLFCAILSFQMQTDWVTCYISVLFLILSIYKLFFARFVIVRRQYKLLAKTYGVTEWTRSIEFSENEILISDHTSSMKYAYNQITKIKEKGNVVFLFLSNNGAIRLYKDAFVGGTWEECKQKILSHL